MSDNQSVDIRVDLSQCAALYDYNKGERIEKPAEGWDAVLPEVLKRHCGYVLPSGKEFNQWLDLMDYTWRDEKLLDKRVDVKKDSIPRKDGLSSDAKGQMPCDSLKGALPYRILPVYKPGDVIKGEVILNLTEPMSADNMVIHLAGETRVQVSLDNPVHENYVDETQTIWRSDVKERKGVLLPAGKSRYSYEFRLPESAPGSIPPLTFSFQDTAYLVYRLKAIINRGTPKRNVIASRGLWVERPYDVASVPGNLSPVKKEEVLKTGIVGTSGSVTLRVTLPSRAWLLGNTIPLEVDVDNQSKDEILKVKARVALVGTCRSSTDKSTPLQHKIKLKGVKREETAIAPGMSPKFQWDIPLDFSPSPVHSNLMPVGTLEVSQYLDMQYVMMIKVKRKRLQKDVKLEIPIIVGTWNSEVKP